MIKRRRDDVSTPEVLAAASAAAVTERQNAEAYYQQVPIPTKAYSFKLYKNITIKKSLEQLFKEKCAYCETRYEVSQPVDVEHFRPKAEVELEAGSTLSPGYWWLAATWENLLPSCIHCNRRSKHKLPTGEVRVIGKGNFFPLAAGQLHARNPGGELGETPLLIDPTQVDPDQHLEFVDDLRGTVPYSIVKAKAVNGTVSDKGSKTIEYYALNRMGLVKARLEQLTRLANSLRQIERMLKKIDNTPVTEQERANILEDVKEDIAAIKNIYLNDEAIYSAAANALFRKWVLNFIHLVQI